MSSVPDKFTDWISRLPQWRGLRQLSPERPYAHAEEGYDDQYGVTAPEPQEGEGLCALLETHGIDTAGPALEIGCGTGRLTYGLARHYPGPDFLVTDPSQAFLRITQAQFGSGQDVSTRLHYAVLNADDLGQLPTEMFSLITMRSTLHHILGVDEFIIACAKILRPDGALVMGAEPCEYGYVLMGAIGQSIVPVLTAAGIEVRPAWKKQVQGLLDTIKFYCRHDLDKTTAEDKHLFNPHEMADLGAAHGLQLRFYPNASFSDFAPPHEPAFVSFTVFFMNYLKYCLLFDAELLKLIQRHLKPQMRYIDDCYRSHVGPAMTGVFLLKKTSVTAC
jgi:SAM-dependent methyltransferase